MILNNRFQVWLISIVAVWFIGDSTASAQKPKRSDRSKVVKDADLPWPPVLKDGKTSVTTSSPKLLQAPDTIRTGVAVAKQPPTVSFQFYPNQMYPGKPWSNWGDGCFAGGKYYSAIGDHYAIGRGTNEFGTGTAFVYEYDPQSQKLRSLVDVSNFLNLPPGHYTPGKIHSRVDMGSDGWLYYATHRGSPKAANDVNHYKGDWIFRTHPKSGRTEIVAHAPVAKHSIPNSVLDAERMIFYGGTAAGPDAELQDIQFFAYDVSNRKMLLSKSDGPARYMILAKSTGKLYYVPGNSDGELLRFDPAEPSKVVSTGQTIGVRAATEETSDGFVYSVSTGQQSGDATIWQFNTRTEKAKAIGTVGVGAVAYVASIDVDPTGRFLYYVPGAHGSSHKDGSPLVQFDVHSGKKKVIAYLHPLFQEQHGVTLKGTYSTAVSNDGSTVFITWNVSRGTRAWDCCGLAVVQIPESER